MCRVENCCILKLDETRKDSYMTPVQSTQTLEGTLALHYDDGNKSGWYGYPSWFFSLIGSRIQLFPQPYFLPSEAAEQLRWMLLMEDPGAKVELWEMKQIQPSKTTIWPLPWLAQEITDFLCQSVGEGFFKMSTYLKSILAIFQKHTERKDIFSVHGVSSILVTFTTSAFLPQGTISCFAIHLAFYGRAKLFLKISVGTLKIAGHFTYRTSQFFVRAVWYTSSIICATSSSVSVRSLAWKTIRNA